MAKSFESSRIISDNQATSTIALSFLYNSLLTLTHIKATHFAQVVAIVSG